MIIYERISGETVAGDVESNGVLIPFGNLRHFSDEELQEYLLRRVILPDPEPEVDTPQSISDRQFFQQLALDGKITEEEALIAVKVGDLPQLLMDFVNTLPVEQRFNARMLLEGATEFRRDHPMTVVIGIWQNMSDAEVDEFFRKAASL